MLQSMREGAKSTGSKIIIGLIAISFAAFGIESLFPSGSGNAVAEVNGEDITVFDLQQAVVDQKRRLAQILGDQIDPALLDDDRLRPGALSGLIDRRLLLQTGNILGLVASQQQIGEIVAATTAFQIDGQFSVDQYKIVLANNGLTPERFRRMQSEAIVLDQLQSSIVNSEFVTPAEAAAGANILAERRDVRYLLIDRADVLEIDAIDAAAQRAYFDANPEVFLAPEQVIAEYILLSRADYLEPVSEAELEAAFEDAITEYEVASQSLVSHILLIQQDTESADDYAARINSVAQRLTEGELLADIVGEVSDDIGSSAFGGALGYTDGTAFPEAMEEAIAALAVGETSGPVQTEAGTHFIRVDDRTAGESANEEQLRRDLRESLQTAAAQRALLIDVETVRDIAFNAPDLSAAAQGVGAIVQRSQPFDRNEGEGLFANSRVREAVFSEEVFDRGNNSDVVELADNRFAVVRVAERLPPRQRIFAEVAEEVEAILREATLREGLAALERRAAEQLDQGDSLETIAETEGLEWRVELGATRTNTLLPRAVRDAAFAMSVADSQRLELVDLDSEQWALIQLARSVPGRLQSLAEIDQRELSSQIGGDYQQRAWAEYLRALKSDSDIVIR